MEERPFSRKTLTPTEEVLKKELASVAPCYHQLMDVTKTFSKEWNYSKSGGWMQKVFDNKKALLYLIPLRNKFSLSLTVRENEREVLLNDIEIDSHKEQLAQAKKYSEGYAMRFLINNKESFLETVLFIKKIIALRK
ncbi:MAG: DUF3788 family protein [Candidatus Kryptoniota bacterium]